MTNGKVAGSNGKTCSAHMLLVRISEELQEVFSTAETPLVSGGKGEEKE